MPNNKTDSQATPDTGIGCVQVGGTAEVSSQRRKLIKASAAAIPAVMTLRSGAASAMSAYGCTTHDNTVAREQEIDQFLEPAGGGELAHDHWVRVPGKRVIDQGNTVYCVETGSGGKPSAPTWNCYGTDGAVYPRNLSAQTIERGDNVALLAYLNFDQYGNDTADPELFYPVIRMVQPAPPGYSPLTYSCLSSIHPNLELL